MWLLVGEVRNTQGQQPTIWIWVAAESEAEALELARPRLAADGWRLEHLEVSCPTEEADYFRDCESFQAFRKARETGLAWRLDDSSAPAGCHLPVIRMS